MWVDFSVHADTQQVNPQGNLIVYAHYPLREYSAKAAVPVQAATSTPAEASLRELESVKQQHAERDLAWSASAPMRRSSCTGRARWRSGDRTLAIWRSGIVPNKQRHPLGAVLAFQSGCRIKPLHYPMSRLDSRLMITGSFHASNTAPSAVT